jgi:hypothetical protein
MVAILLYRYEVSIQARSHDRSAKGSGRPLAPLSRATGGKIFLVDLRDFSKTFRGTREFLCSRHVIALQEIWG